MVPLDAQVFSIVSPESEALLASHLFWVNDLILAKVFWEKKHVFEVVYALQIQDLQT